MKHLHLKLNFSPASVLWCRVSYVTLKSIIGEYFRSINWCIFQRASPTFTICQLKVIGGIVQYLSVARGTEINFIDLETEFN